MVSKYPTDFVESGYVFDDVQLIYKILSANWRREAFKDDVVIFWDEDNDISTFNFSTGEIAIKILDEEMIIEKKGMARDSEQIDRFIQIDVRTLSRERLLSVMGEIRRILNLYRVRPGNEYDVLDFVSYYPKRPSYKFYHGQIKLVLKNFYKMVPNPNWLGCSGRPKP